MATSLGIRLFQPLRVWLGICILMLCLLVMSAAWIFKLSAVENQKLADVQRDTLVRARISDLEARNYRAVVEGLGVEFPNLYVEIKSPDGDFQAGERRNFEKCSSASVDVHRTQAGPVDVTLCRPYHLPLIPFGVIIGLFLVAAAFSFGLIAQAEKQAVTTLADFFLSQGVSLSIGRGLAGIFSKMKDIIGQLDVAKRREIDMAKTWALAEVASQVAHDITSPLAALDAMARGALTLPVDQRSVLKDALARIHGITDDLIDKANETLVPSQVGAMRSLALRRLPRPLAPSVQSVMPLIESIVSEKRIAYRHLPAVTITSPADGEVEHLLVKVSPQDFKRALSNVVNNAIESLKNGSGSVRITAFAREHDVIVRVSDDGVGMSANVAAMIAKSPGSFGKTGGLGLGLKQVRRMAHNAGGALEIESREGLGTTVDIILPKARNGREAPASNESRMHGESHL